MKSRPVFWMRKAWSVPQAWRVMLSALVDIGRRMPSLWSVSAKKGKWQVNLGRLSNGERISGVSAILLFAFMFFYWFGVKAVNTSNLLFAVQSIEPGKSAWEALEYIPIVLLITIIVTLAVAALRLTNAVRKFPVPVNALVAILGLVSMLLILYRIVDPPIFHVEITITDEGAAQLPIFLALLAAAGITFGGCLAMRKEGCSRFARLRQPGQSNDWQPDGAPFGLGGYWVRFPADKRPDHGDSGSPVWNLRTGASIGLISAERSEDPVETLVAPLLHPPNMPANRVPGILHHAGMQSLSLKLGG
jgi:hypothetical protein